MNNYDHREDKSCYFHPTEFIIGVCHMCLNERLIVLASKQSSNNNLHKAKSRRSLIRNFSFSSSNEQKPQAIVNNNLPKIFAIGSLLNRFEFRHRKSQDHEDFSDASSSHEDSFISIKFENNNGIGSWEKNNNATNTAVNSKVSLEHCNFSWSHNLVSKASSTNKTVVEHVKPQSSKLRWRKRIGHLFQLSKWKRSSVCHVGGKQLAEGVKVGWIRSLTKRRTKE